MTFVPYWIDAARAKETIEAGQAIVLDVTSPFIESAVRGKIPGAVRVSPRDILDVNRQGYDAWMLEGGLPAWRAAGYPMELNQAA
jgi:rhodanese-related sulfurtransferase